VIAVTPTTSGCDLGMRFGQILVRHVVGHRVDEMDVVKAVDGLRRGDSFDCQRRCPVR
jgi:hypothetical protein